MTEQQPDPTPRVETSNCDPSLGPNDVRFELKLSLFGQKGILVRSDRSEERRVGKEGRDERTPEYSSRRRHTRSLCDWSSDVCSSDLWQTAPLNLSSMPGDIFYDRTTARSDAKS